MYISTKENIDDEVDEFFKKLSELRYAIDLDTIGKVCRKYTVSISATWDADGRVELSCYPWETVGVNDDN